MINMLNITILLQTYYCGFRPSPALSVHCKSLWIKKKKLAERVNVCRIKSEDVL